MGRTLAAAVLLSLCFVLPAAAARNLARARHSAWHARVIRAEIRKCRLIELKPWGPYGPEPVRSIKSGTKEFRGILKATRAVLADRRTPRGAPVKGLGARCIILYRVGTRKAYRAKYAELGLGRHYLEFTDRLSLTKDTRGRWTWLSKTRIGLAYLDCPEAFARTIEAATEASRSGKSVLQARAIPRSL